MELWPRFIFELSKLMKKAGGFAVTKWSILQVVKGTYEPPGLTSPVLISKKVLFLELCVNKVKWDDRGVTRGNVGLDGSMTWEVWRKSWYPDEFTRYPRDKLAVHRMDLPRPVRRCIVPWDAFHSTKIFEISSLRSNGMGKVLGKVFLNVWIRFECTLSGGIFSINKMCVFHSGQTLVLVYLPSMGSRRYMAKQEWQAK